VAGGCNGSQDAQDAWDAGDVSLASGRNAGGSDAGSVFADVDTASTTFIIFCVEKQRISFVIWVFRL